MVRRTTFPHRGRRSTQAASERHHPQPLFLAPPHLERIIVTAEHRLPFFHPQPQKQPWPRSSPPLDWPAAASSMRAFSRRTRRPSPKWSSPPARAPPPARSRASRARAPPTTRAPSSATATRTLSRTRTCAQRPAAPPCRRCPHPHAPAHPRLALIPRLSRCSRSRRLKVFVLTLITLYGTYMLQYVQ